MTEINNAHSKAQRNNFIRPLDPAAMINLPYPKYSAQVYSSNESGIFLNVHIGEGGCGPNLHYHPSDQLYFLTAGSMKVRLRDHVFDAVAGDLVYIPAGLPHCNWNNVPGGESHLEMIIPKPAIFDQLAYPIGRSEDVPENRRTTLTGYVRKAESVQCKEFVPGFKMMELANSTLGSDKQVVLYAEVESGKSGPETHIHTFDQYCFLLDGEMTVEVALEEYVVKPSTLVVFPAGVPHRQYNSGSTINKLLIIMVPAPSEGQPTDTVVNFAATGKNYTARFDSS